MLKVRFRRAADQCGTLLLGYLQRRGHLSPSSLLLAECLQVATLVVWLVTVRLSAARLQMVRRLPSRREST